MADTFDFIVAGGGSAGCAVASRLSEDPKTSVALIEAGGRDANWVVTTPGALALMVPSKINNWAFDTRAGLNGRIGYQPRGKGLGGPSSINAMVYIRGHKRDYDQWASLGNTGWSFADVLPIFKRSEHNADFDGEYHGKGGPLHVNKLRMMIRSYKWGGNISASEVRSPPLWEGARIRQNFEPDESDSKMVLPINSANTRRPR